MLGSRWQSGRTGCFMGEFHIETRTLGPGLLAPVSWQDARQPLWFGRIISIRFAGDINSVQIVGSKCRESHNILW